MTDDQLLEECKKGLNIPLTSTAFDNILNQKLFAVKGYMRGAGISDEVMDSDLAVAVIVLGVGDLWNVNSGEIKFSPVLSNLMTQLSTKSLLLTVTSNPVDAAIDIAITIEPTLTFNKRITDYEVSIVEYDDVSIVIPTTISLNVTGKILTVSPDSVLESGTKYAIVIESATAFNGPELSRTIISFTTI
jgi:hypothetical protein